MKIVQLRMIKLMKLCKIKNFKVETNTKMMIKEVELQNYLFNTDVYEINPKTRLEITNNLRREMIEIFSGTNVYQGDGKIE